MNKKILLTSLFVQIALLALAQGKVENLLVGWPPEYKWKIAKQQEDSLSSNIMMIPGRDKIINATIIAGMRAIYNVKSERLEEIEDHYRKSIDTGTTLTILKRNPEPPNFWVLFKTETPATNKYPQPESDLYYVTQGEYTLFEVHVAIKKSNLDEAFVKKWSAILEEAKLIVE